MKTQRTKRQQVSDELWEAIAPLIPPEPPKPKGGRPPVGARQALGGILFVLRTGIGWQELEQIAEWLRRCETAEHEQSIQQ